MPPARPFRSDGLLFPPPPKRANQKIYCVVVEKKGDETRTSMRQSEIYAYSSDIIIRDGFMVMPKCCWKDYNPGDWFRCEAEFSVDRNGNLKEERELISLNKIDQNSYHGFQIPETRFRNGYVQIVTSFVLCPDFIRNKEISNSFGRYRKLYLLNIGQGFVNTDNRHWKDIKPGRVYTGIFEFRAKDNGAVNFGHRYEIRDSTGHVLERDAMWQLNSIPVGTTSVPIAEHTQMREDLLDLKGHAEACEKKLIEEGFYGPVPQIEQVPQMAPPPPQPRAPEAPKQQNLVNKIMVKPAHKSRGNVRADQLINELTRLQTRSPERFDDEYTLSPVQQSTSAANTPERVFRVAPTQFPQVSVHVPAPSRRLEGEDVNRETVIRHEELVVLEDYRGNTSNLNESTNSSRTVFRNPAPEEVVITNIEELEAHRARTIMLASFHVPGSGQLVQKWIDRETQETSTLKDILDFKFDLRYRERILPLVNAIERIELNVHDITAADQPPLASSTPLGSPVAVRRAEVNVRTTRNPFPNDNDDTYSGSLVELRRDNNANPTRPRHERYTPEDYRN